MVLVEIGLLFLIIVAVCDISTGKRVVGPARESITHL